jgi:hypothetical protein
MNTVLQTPLQAQSPDPLMPDETGTGIGHDVIDPIRPDIVPDDPLNDDEMDRPL